MGFSTSLGSASHSYRLQKGVFHSLMVLRLGMDGKKRMQVNLPCYIKYVIYGENYYCGYSLYRSTECLSLLYPCAKCNSQWSGVYGTDL